MSLILNIDTSTEIAHISIAKDGQVLLAEYNSKQKDHAAFLQPAIKALFEQLNMAIGNLDAVAITAGPGSYTGLRVAMASAKGICYALNKPLICLNTLQVLAASALPLLKLNPIYTDALLCPMLDARRMEVFTAIYNIEMELLLPPNAMILNENSFNQQLKNEKLLFLGNGSNKWKGICSSSNAYFEEVLILPQALANLSHANYLKGSFANLALSLPDYLKDFHNTVHK